MIATACEPVEFIPAGRKAVEEHPSNSNYKPVPTEQMLLQRLQNVDLSATETHQEFWSVREIFDDGTKQERNNMSNADFMCEYLINSEEELYVKKCTAVWTKGITDGRNILPRTCFTCETPIKFAFFCSNNFVCAKKTVNGGKGKRAKAKAHKKPTSICMIDHTALRVYCSSGEDYLANLQFPVSHVWPTSYGLLLEKVASSTIIQNHTISMPRLFSLSHPLDEMCPVLFKNATNAVAYIVEPDFSIIYSSDETDLLLMYDNKIGKHFIARMRKATEEEINFVSAHNDSTSTCLPQFSQLLKGGFSGIAVGSNLSHNSTKFRATPKNISNNYTTHVSKFLTTGQSFSSVHVSNSNRTTHASPLSNLQSTIGQHLISAQDIRKMGQAQPSKPIIPEFCLEHIWSESIPGNRDFCEISTRAFKHTDLVAQSYICYLLPRSCKLQLIRLSNNEETDVQISSTTAAIPAKDAVALQRMKMIAVLDPSGSLLLYTGTAQICKVHVAHSLMPSPRLREDSKPTKLTPNTRMSKSPEATSFPKRSSLLPSIQKPSDSIFEDELHMLSPVQPLYASCSTRASTICLGLRDPAGNRLTLIYPGGVMYRITLPLISETHFVQRCITTLRQILTKEQFIELITSWYAVRNPKGSRDYSIQQEWETFKTLLIDLMGCAAATHGIDSSTALNSSNEPKRAKKRREDDIIEGTDEDWDFMLSILAGGDGTKGNTYMSIPSHNTCHSIDTSACLFKTIPAIFYGLHLLYEDFKLDSALHDYLPHLAKFLHQLAVDMQLSSYIFHYILDYPELVHKTNKIWQLTEAHGALMTQQELLQLPAPSIFKQVEHILMACETYPYPYVDDMNGLSRSVLQVISLIIHGHDKMRNWIKPLEFPNNVHAQDPPRVQRFISTNLPQYEQLIEMLNNMGMKRSDIETLPVALHLIIAECLEYARIDPPIGSTTETYELILRQELVAHTKIGQQAASTHVRSHIDVEDSLSARCPPTTGGLAQITNDDGMDKIDSKLFSLRFPDDMRVAEVRRLLCSFEPVIIDLVQATGTSDHEFIEEQEKQLFAMCIRTMALPTGRGMFTLRTLLPSPTESMPIPKLCLTGKEPIKNTTIEMTQIEFPATLTLWPSFHNGVAAGLKISPNARDVDSTWIVFNRPKGQTEISTEHAGFLMALGLNGHLKTLTFMSIYEYLVKCDEMTSVGLLLGISATHKGTMDNNTTKLLSVHVEALLPATALELDIPQTIQVAALMGVGLVYMGTAKRHIAEVLLQEIGRPPGPEMENSVERESYALTAGLALGLVTLGQGETPAGLQDLQLPDTLHYYMVGGTKRPLAGSQKEKYKLPSFQVREGEQANIDVTAPGATLALGLMFFNTDNDAVAEWMAPPNTRYLLDLVRPDLLLLRTISRGLILWSKVRADEDWLFNQFPENLKFDIERGAVSPDDAEDIDHEAITQAYCNIITGAAFCIGLKYAGTEDPVAFKTLWRAIKLFLGFPGKYVGEYAGRSLIESNLMLILISLALVFAGSGHLDILRLIRYLRSRVGPQHSNVAYGSYLATHMALGLLFLGAGRFTIAKTPEAIAALVCAFFPKFPNHSNDNRFHLQAFRHLYVLAVEPRLFLPRDIDTKKLCLCNISVLEVGSTRFRRLPTLAPCMLPDLSTLRKVIVDDSNYWPVCFERDRNWDQLVKALANSECIDIKKRSGCLSHLEDPDRLKSLLAETLTTEQYLCWEIEPAALERFSNDPHILAFVDRFLHTVQEEVVTGESELSRKHQLTMLFHNAVIKDKMHVFPIYLNILNHVGRFQTQTDSHDVWQIKLIDTYIRRYKGEQHILFSKEIVSSQLERCKLAMERALNELHTPLYDGFLLKPTFEPTLIANLSPRNMSRLIAVIIYYNLTPNLLNMINISGEFNYGRFLMEFQKLQLDMLSSFCLLRLLRRAKS